MSMQTKIIDTAVPTIYQKVTSFSDVQVVNFGVEEAKGIITTVLERNERFNLLLDFREIDFSAGEYTLNAHRAWAMGFKENPLIKEHADRVAILGMDSSKFRAEKEFMDTEKVRRYTDPAEALSWLGIAFDGWMR